MIVFTDRVEVPAHVMVRFLDNESVFLNLVTPNATSAWIKPARVCGR